jgi:hypothetical protein
MVNVPILPFEKQWSTERGMQTELITQSAKNHCPTWVSCESASNAMRRSSQVGNLIRQSLQEEHERSSCLSPDSVENVITPIVASEILGLQRIPIELEFMLIELLNMEYMSLRFASIFILLQTQTYKLRS